MENNTLSISACALSNCHDSVTRQSGIDLSLADPFTPLVGKAPDTTVSANSACGTSTQQIINATTPNQSLLYTKISATPPCGATMPFPLGPMDNGAGAECVLQWIQANLAQQ
jgi:hypothetical protein